jgi:hypothetical protein
MLQEQVKWVRSAARRTDARRLLVTRTRNNQTTRYGWAPLPILVTMLAVGCAPAGHKHAEYEANIQAVQQATQNANAAAAAANTAAARAQQAAVRSEAAAVRAERAALKAEAIFKKGLRK